MGSDVGEVDGTSVGVGCEVGVGIFVGGGAETSVEAGMTVCAADSGVGVELVQLMETARRTRIGNTRSWRT